MESFSSQAHMKQIIERFCVVLEKDDIMTSYKDIKVLVTALDRPDKVSDCGTSHLLSQGEINDILRDVGQSFWIYVCKNEPSSHETDYRDILSFF